MSQTVTSKISAVPAQIKAPGAFGYGGVRKTAFVATKVSKTRNSDGRTTYEVELIQYDDAKGTNPQTIASGYTFYNAARDGSGDALLGGDDFSRLYLDVDQDIKNSSPALANEIEKGSINRLFKSQLRTDPKIKELAGTAEERDALDSASGSTVTENPNQTGGDTSTDAPEPTQAERLESIAAGFNQEFNVGDNSQTRQNYDLNLRYPLALETRTQDTLKIDVIKFKPRKFDGGFGFGARDADGTRTPVGSVILPVTNVADKNNVGWGGVSMNAVDVALAGLAMNTIMAGGDGFMESAKTTLNALSNERSGIKKGIAAYFAQAATGTKGILARTEGAIINPNFELLFNGPKLRSFAFTYRMSARSEPETIMIRKIIRMFKQSMAVQRSTENLFLKAPNTYKLTFRKSTDAMHNFLPKVKECALVSFNVNYVPDGTYATFENSSMVAYELQFQFSELEPIYNDDYSAIDGNTDDFIGF
tara:strand:- start:59 stop:1489 length:1431 start_codon:yes stop_codon:yes gene_type:complete